MRRLKLHHLTHTLKVMLNLCCPQKVSVHLIRLYGGNALNVLLRLEYLRVGVRVGARARAWAWARARGG